MSAEKDPKPGGGAVQRFALRYWVAIALAVLAGVFVMQNRDSKRVNLLWITVESPMWLLLGSMVFLGIVIGLLLHRRRK